jgi:hypothetical protein
VTVDPARAGSRQALMREVNDRIVDVMPHPRLTPSLEILCECVNDECTEWLTVSDAEYEEVRNRPRWFFVRPDHVVPDVERVVRDGERFVVVEKLGEAGAVAGEAHDSSRAD